jgi:hypothetical protein
VTHRLVGRGYYRGFVASIIGVLYGFYMVFNGFFIGINCQDMKLMKLISDNSNRGLGT